MSLPETRMGGSQEAFPETAWSKILARPEPGSPARRPLMEALCSTYWKPVYAFIRASFGKSVEDAKDLTQEFFCRVVEEDLVAGYDAAKGRFRPFLKSALRHFLANAHREGRAEKRGGGRRFLPLDADCDVEDPAGRAPEEIFDREWIRELLARCIPRLKRVLSEDGKAAYFDVYEAYDLRGDGDRPTYGRIAQTLGLTVPDVTNFLHHARARLHALVIESVAESVGSPEDLREELRELFSS